MYAVALPLYFAVALLAGFTYGWLRNKVTGEDLGNLPLTGFVVFGGCILGMAWAMYCIYLATTN